MTGWVNIPLVGFRFGLFEPGKIVTPSYWCTRGITVSRNAQRLRKALWNIDGSIRPIMLLPDLGTGLIILVIGFHHFIALVQNVLGFLDRFFAIAVVAFDCCDFL